MFFWQMKKLRVHTVQLALFVRPMIDNLLISPQIAFCQMQYNAMQYDAMQTDD